MSFIKNLFSKFVAYVREHKIKGVIIIVLAALCFYYIGTKLFGTSTTQTSYTVEKAIKGTVIETITGTGQISSSNQVELKAKASGAVTKIYVSTGDEVKAGTLLASIDPGNAALSVASARISLAKLTKDADKITVLQAENNLDSAKDDKVKSYDTGFSTAATSIIDTGDILASLHSLISDRDGYLNDNYSSAVSDTTRQYKQDVARSFDSANNQYNSLVTYYKSLSRASDLNSLDTLLSQTKTTLESLSVTLKKAKMASDFIHNEKGSTDSAGSAVISSISSWTSKTNTNLSSVVSSINTTSSSVRAIREKEIALEDVRTGNDPLDIESARLNLQQKINDYENYFIRAPFDGVVAKIAVNPTNDVTSGTSIATLVTKQKIAEISLNEVDIAKVKSGQKVNLTFDAVEGLNITGKVLDVDLVGTVTQGVVSYNVKIGLDTDDERIKSGMSVSASIITDMKQDVVTVPVSAVKTQGNQSYVEVFTSTLPDTSLGQILVQTWVPIQKEVTVGLSNDTTTEITSGLNDGDQVITKTTKGAATTKTAPSITSSLFGGRAASGSTGRAMTGK